MIEYDEINTLISDYYDWLKKETQITIVEGSNWVAIDTPFYDMYDDAIRLYLKKEHTNYILSDNSVTLNNLSELGINFHKGAKKKILDNILSFYNVKIENQNEITMNFSASNFIASKYSMLELILKLTDLTYLAKEKDEKTTPKDVVKEILNQEKILYTPDVSITGKSGLEHKFDFIIPGHKEEILLSTVNEINTSKLSAFIYSCHNVRDKREQTTGKTTKPYLVVKNEESLNDVNISAIEFEHIKLGRIKSGKDIFVNDMKNVA